MAFESQDDNETPLSDDLSAGHAVLCEHAGHSELPPQLLVVQQEAL